MSPTLVRDIASLRQALEPAHRRGQRVGLVPTMGALHAGHASLMAAARRECEVVVVSIFVNPAQFGPNEDLARYPRQLTQDLAVCAEQGVDLVFHPEPSILYPPGYCTYVEVTRLQEGLCGAARPGHFRGVATVVLKLFNLVRPTRAYFGEKDAQQLRLIQQMAQDLDLTVEVVAMPTVREPDGLALSSRNQYLDRQQRQQAPLLYQALCEARRRIEEGLHEGSAIQQLLEERIKAIPGATLDYAAVVNADTLQPLPHLQGNVLLALAVKLGSTRLIDNVRVRV